MDATPVDQLIKELKIQRPGVINYYLFLQDLVRLEQPKIIVDIGTADGGSATAMSHPRCDIHTFDIMRSYHDFDDDPKYRIMFHQADLLTPVAELKYKDLLASAGLVFLDTDPHDGIQEPKFIELFERHLLPGTFVVFDDIHMNPSMEKFWGNLVQRTGWDCMDISTFIRRDSGFGIAQWKGTDGN